MSKRAAHDAGKSFRSRVRRSSSLRSPIHPMQRDAFLKALAAELERHPVVGPGVVFRAAAPCKNLRRRCALRNGTRRGVLGRARRAAHSGGGSAPRNRNTTATPRFIGPSSVLAFFASRQRWSLPTKASMVWPGCARQSRSHLNCSGALTRARLDRPMRSCRAWFLWRAEGPPAQNSVKMAFKHPIRLE